MINVPPEEIVHYIHPNVKKVFTKLMKACSSCKRYKGIHAPKCNNGTPCEACLNKYKENQK